MTQDFKGREWKIVTGKIIDKMTKNTSKGKLLVLALEGISERINLWEPRSIEYANISLGDVIRAEGRVKVSSYVNRNGDNVDTRDLQVQVFAVGNGIIPDAIGNAPFDETPYVSQSSNSYIQPKYLKQATLDKKTQVVIYEEVLNPEWRPIEGHVEPQEEPPDVEDQVAV